LERCGATNSAVKQEKGCSRALPGLFSPTTLLPEDLNPRFRAAASNIIPAETTLRRSAGFLSYPLTATRNRTIDSQVD
jgi:hypothetical protein